MLALRMYSWELWPQASAPYLAQLTSMQFGPSGQQADEAMSSFGITSQTFVSPVKCYTCGSAKVILNADYSCYCIACGQYVSTKDTSLYTTDCPDSLHGSVGI